ncbi:NAD(P)H-dependent oxidoreductase [Agrococcus jejuensis]|uniref:Putative NADPH-quinone reductase (Modulator of drug activity B) n=1 Tax=Agrococcus jejuensis TaxID=399736 RepID=A0A1G8B7C7_9MICO|nr:NAD(P)H-dependent oxidoreductase [Agrococcus jejuensis]SDH29139.1 Putative NADPH-quinone reductase (modulator of drug activity B) [Agrococcus jejuensis]
MRTLVIDGHPNPDSLSAALAARYAAESDDARLLVVRDLDFDLVLHRGYRGEQPFEPDLADALQAIRDAEHVVVVTPVWWGSVPALLKGFLDRVLVYGEAFRYTERGTPEGLLAGRTGRLVVTSDSPRWYLPLVGDTTVRHLRTTTLRFCGIRPVRLTRATSVRSSTPERRERWLDRMASDARRDGAATDAGRRSDERSTPGMMVR